MRRTKEQIKKAILDAMFTDPSVIKTSVIMELTGLSRESVDRYKDEVYEDFIDLNSEKIKKAVKCLEDLIKKENK
jgi:hypothetical protein